MSENVYMQQVELQCGMEVYINGASVGYLGNGCSMTVTKTDVPLYQGEPSVLQGSRVAKIEGSLNIPFLCQTPEISALASGNAQLVETSAERTEEVQEPYRLSDNVILMHDFVDDTTIVVTSSDSATTYVEDTDYTVSTENNHTTITRVESGSIADGTDILVSYEYTAYATTPYLFGGVVRPAYEVGPIVLHKRNPGGGDFADHTIIIWRATPQGDYSRSYDMESSTWNTLNVNMLMLDDSADTNNHHDLCPLYMEVWNNEEYAFDINNLPTVPTTYNNARVFGAE